MKANVWAGVSVSYLYSNASSLSPLADPFTAHSPKSIEKINKPKMRSISFREIKSIRNPFDYTAGYEAKDLVS